jgi:hypothetical protein
MVYVAEEKQATGESVTYKFFGQQNVAVPVVVLCVLLCEYLFCSGLS